MGLPSLLAPPTMTDSNVSKQPLVLVADDDRALRKLLNLALVQEGYSVVQASSGAQVLQDFQRLQPDVVLLDAMMPEMDGFETCRYLRTVYQTSVPILIVTVLDDQQSIDQAYEAGATDYITKPIHWAVLRQRVRHLLNSERSLQQAQHMVTQLASAQAWETLQRRLLKDMFAGQLCPQSLSQSVELIKHCFAAQQVWLLEAATAQLTTLDNVAMPALTQEQIRAVVTPLKQALADHIEVIQWPQEALAVLEEGRDTIAHTFNAAAWLIGPIVCASHPWGWLIITRQTATLWTGADRDRLQDLAHLIGFSLVWGATAIPDASGVEA